MQTEPYLPINFTISAEAWAEIENIRMFWNSRFEDKADVLVVAWGRTILNDGRTWSHVVISFYGLSERYKAEHAIQIISGHEVVFFTTPEFYDKFDGKIIKFEPDKSFFLASD
jgi:hypothetical protein